MPVVALLLLSLFIDIKSAAMLLSMPLILINLPQALERGKTGRCLMQLMPVILGMIPGLFLGVRVLLALDANVAKNIAGLVLMGVGGVTLSWLDVSVWTAAMLPAVLGMHVGHHKRDKIAPETFKTLLLIAVIAAGAELLRHGFFS